MLITENPEITDPLNSTEILHRKIKKTQIKSFTFLAVFFLLIAVGIFMLSNCMFCKYILYFSK